MGSTVFETGKKNYTCDILIVDDDEFNLKVAGDILKENFSVSKAKSGKEALRFLEISTPKLILLDLHMPEMDGRAVMKKIQEHEEWRNIPIIFLTADSNPEIENECLVLGAHDFITKPFVPMVMQSRISRIMELSALQNDLQSRLEEKSKLVEKVSLNSIMAIANTIDAKDAYTSGHSVRVAKCSVAIARRLNWEESEVQNLHYVALLHDIGKIGVPDAILNKPSRLSNEEFEIIKKHPVIGNDILKDIHMIKNVAEGALYHHERYDGRGYPFGTSGEDIPLYARIICVADAYDAMTSNRVYRSKLSASRVIEEFEKGRGTQFDPQLTDIFLEMLHERFDVSRDSSIFWDDDLMGESSALLNKVLKEYTADIQSNAATDALTGLHNRTSAVSRIEKLLEDGHEGSLLMIDMDNFKRINDTYGHIVGDKTLKLFAEALKACTRPEDVLCRLHGDEFVVFLTDITGRQEAGAKAREILDLLAEKLRELDKEDATSVSIGIAIYPGDGKSFEILYNNADKSLYYVKQNGKNSYSFYSDENPRNNGQNTEADLNQIRRMIEGDTDEQKGIFKVGYEDFNRLYKYISRGVKRNQQQVQTVLFTLCYDDSQRQEAHSEDAMMALELSVASSLRMVDVGTKYSSMQYIVILVDSDLENGKNVAGRVIKQFYRMYGGGDVTVSYDIQTLTPKMEEE